jgi:hypothetical protein
MIFIKYQSKIIHMNNKLINMIIKHPNIFFTIYRFLIQYFNAFSRTIFDFPDQGIGGQVLI